VDPIHVDPIYGRGVSSLEVKECLLPHILGLHPRRVFDVGCGIGAYGALLRLSDPTIEVIGIDGYLPYLLQQGVREFYAVAIHAPIERVIDGTIRVDADLTMCVDVVEHFPKETALRLLALPGRMVVGTPLFDYRQGPVEGNVFEEHKCWFTAAELNALGFKTLGVFDHVALDGQMGKMGAFERES
jgi:SAM-dependent methyltransferase